MMIEVKEMDNLHFLNIEQTAEELVEETLERQRGKCCVGCDLKFPLYWQRVAEPGEAHYWYHEDGGGGVICERHPDNEEYWRKCAKVQD
jgi:hypothetical protein